MSAQANGAGPIVSIIVRSMGRALLSEAVESILRQDYSPIEVVVVDAKGAHAPLSAKWVERGVHLVSLGRRGRRLAKLTARREALWTPVQVMLAEARRALESGDRARAQMLSDEIYEKFQIRFALQPGEMPELPGRGSRASPGDARCSTRS